MNITLSEFCRRCGIEKPADAAGGMPLTTFLTDSRSLFDPSGTVFFAIDTPTNSGSNYIPGLYEEGVRVFVTGLNYQEPADLKGEAVVLRVDDPLKALQRVSTRPESYDGEIVAITGSRGKTMLKEWLYQLLEPLTPTVRSPRSYNSQIGVPLSMTEIGDDTKVAVIEAGISREGEMARLRGIIRPDTVIITNVGEEHDEGFSGRESKIREKLSLAADPATRRLIYCADDEDLSKAVESMDSPQLEKISWSASGKDADMKFDVAERFSEGKADVAYSFKGGRGGISVAASTSGDVQNACHALAYMLAKGYGKDVISEGFHRLHPIATRMSVCDGANGCSIVYDSYTSDFSSLLPALDFVARRRMPGQEIVVIMSDMRHESAGEKTFRQIAATLRQRGIRKFVGIGPEFSGHSAIFNAAAEFYNDTESFLAHRGAKDFRESIILLKGAPEFEFGRIMETLEARTHETVLEVNLDALVRNFNYFRSNVPAGTGIVCMVKASGYGAGSYEIAKTLQDAGAAYLAVAVLDEGIDLRRNGITMPIMVMNPKVANYRMMFSNRLEPEIYTFSMLEDVIEAARRNRVADYPIHIKLDTGMHRMGFIEQELPALMDRLSASREVRVSSVFSHLATADCPDMDDYTEKQLATFRRCTEYMLGRSERPFRRHVLNSAGILRYPGNHYDMVRLGIGLYGVNTLPAEMEKPLELVSALRTVVISVREWEAGETIGYGRRGVLKRASKIATIPIGYADGMNRHFGNGAIKVLVNGREAPTIGNICMDACMIDVTGMDCREGDMVEIFGPRAGVQRLADVLGTIPYEVLTSVSPRVRRIYYRE